MNDLPRDPSEQDTLDHWPLSSPPPASMTEALAAVEEDPGDEARWDALEDLVEAAQRPDVVESLYGRLLAGARDRSVAELLGPRAVRFHDEWSGEPETLERLLRLVLRIDVGIGWAFERMTMTLTMGERWGELLALYDQALLATSDLLRRREILDEAAHVAKDFAGQPDRAIDYLWQLLQLRPSDSALASSLERLLEAKGHHRELVRLWELRASVLEGEPSRALRLRAALCWVERVDAPEEAVRALEPLLRERYEEPTVVATLEKIAAHEDYPDAVRSKAYGLLETFFEGARRESDELRVLEGALGVVAADGERIRLHRRAAALLEQHGEDRRALDHLARLVPLVPGEEAAAAALRKLGERTEAFGPVAHALAGAADALGEQPRALALREEAAGLLCDRVNGRAEAARLYLQVFWAEGAAPEQARRVGERLWRERLLIPEQTAELLPALERLFELGPGEEELTPEAWRHELLGETARVARSQGSRSGRCAPGSFASRPTPRTTRRSTAGSTRWSCSSGGNPWSRRSRTGPIGPPTRRPGARIWSGSPRWSPRPWATWIAPSRPGAASRRNLAGKTTPSTPWRSSTNRRGRPTTWSASSRRPSSKRPPASAAPS